MKRVACLACAVSCALIVWWWVEAPPEGYSQAVVGLMVAVVLVGGYLWTRDALK